MATVSKSICDRCRKEIEYKGWTAKLKNVFRKGKHIKISETYNGNPTGYDYCNREYELCASCTKKLEDFLNNKGRR